MKQQQKWKDEERPLENV